MNKENVDLPSIKALLNYFHESVNLVPFVVTITNFTDGSCEYVSPTFKNLTGYNSENFYSGGLNWFSNHIHVEDRIQFKINFSEGFLFLLSLNQDQRLSCSFNLTSRFIHLNGNIIWLYHQCRPIALDGNGKPQYSLNIITDLTHLMPSNSQSCWSIVEEINGFERLHLGGSCNEDLKDVFVKYHSPISKREKQILLNLIKGHSSKTVASKLNLSLSTVQTHRKNILKKTKSSNINEAIQKALNNSWFE